MPAPSPEIDLPHCAAVWESFKAEIDAAYEAIIAARTTRELDRGVAAEAAAVEKLHLAFFEDTKDRNRLENCRLVHWHTIRDWLGKK